jgi:ferredoxin
MRLTVDAGKCSGQGRCYSVAPELLEADDEGFVTIRGAAVDVVPAMTGAARLAADSCPVGAISITDVQPGADDDER